MNTFDTADRPRLAKAFLTLVASVIAVATIAGCSERNPERAGTSQRVDALFAPLTTGVQPGAAVMVIRNGKILHKAGYGYADLDKKVPITADSAFRLASVSKQFTAMAIMVLAVSGSLAYDDPIALGIP